MKTTKRITARHKNLAVSVVIKISTPTGMCFKDEASHRIDRLVDTFVRAVAEGGRYYIQDVKVR